MFANWLCFLPVIGTFLVAYTLLRRRARRLYEGAIAQGYDILGIIDPPLFQQRPFSCGTDAVWSVTRIVPHTSDGREHIGWVCYPTGLPLLATPVLRQVELVWDDEWKQSQGLSGPHP